MKYTLEHLTTPIGVSGQEEEIRSKIIDMMPEGMDYDIDNIGNLTFFPSDAPGLVLTAHMDEIGIMVSGHDKGKLEFVPVGGIDQRSLPNTVVRFTNGKQGVIGLPAPHLVKDRSKAVEMDSLRIDVGCTEEDAKTLFPIGMVGVVENDTFCMMGDTFVSRNTDNRSGCAVLIKLAHWCHKNDYPVQFVFTVREEIGLMGAKALVDTVDPDVEFINVDVTTAGELGGGAIVSVKDGGYMANIDMLNEFRKFAKNFEVGKGGTSDHAAIQSFHKALGISLPSAYIHSSVSKVSLSDMKDAVKLIKTYIRGKYAQ